MKIIELFNKSEIKEGPAGDTIKGGAKSVGRGLRGVAKGANEFISRATDGKVDIGQQVNKYTNIPQTLDKLLGDVYGNGVTSELKREWDDAIKSGDPKRIAEVGKKFKKLEDPNSQDPATGKWASPNKDIIAHLMKA